MLEAKPRYSAPRSTIIILRNYWYVQLRSLLRSLLTKGNAIGGPSSYYQNINTSTDPKEEIMPNWAGCSSPLIIDFPTKESDRISPWLVDKAEQVQQEQGLNLNMLKVIIITLQLTGTGR